MTETALAEEPARPLRRALRQARLEAAERGQAVADLRVQAFARLDMLREALLPVFAEIPPGNDLFDPSLVPGDPPRLFIDLVAFIAMARDQRTYRLLRDTRDGRQVLSEDAEIGHMVAAVTDYVARRIVEREQLLATTDHRSDRVPVAGRASRVPTIAMGFAAGLLAGAAAAAAYLTWP